MAQLDLRPEMRRLALVSLVAHVQRTGSVLGVETVFLALLYNLRRDSEPGFIEGARATWYKYAPEAAVGPGIHGLFYNFETRVLVTLAGDLVRAVYRGAHLAELDDLPSRIVPVATVQNPFGFTSPIFQWPAATPVPKAPEPVVPPAPVPVPSPMPVPVAVVPRPNPVKIERGDRRPKARNGVLNARIQPKSEQELQRESEALAAQREKIREAQRNFYLKTWGVVGAIAGTVLGVVAAAPSILGVLVAAGTGVFAIWYATEEVVAAGRELDASMAKMQLDSGRPVTQTIYIQNQGTVIINMVDGTQVIVTNAKTAGGAGQPVAVPAPAPAAGAGDQDGSGSNEGQTGGFGGPGGSFGGGGVPVSEPHQADEDGDGPEEDQQGGQEDGTDGTDNGTIDGVDQGPDFMDTVGGGDGVDGKRRDERLDEPLREEDAEGAE
jgi:hypothetical protein